MKEPATAAETILQRFHRRHDAPGLTPHVRVLTSGPVLFALQYQSDGGWCWTCDSEGWVIPFDQETLKLVGKLPDEARRIPWENVPNQLKRLGHCGNRRERRKERSARRREAWRAHKRASRTPAS